MGRKSCGHRPEPCQPLPLFQVAASQSKCSQLRCAAAKQTPALATATALVAVAPPRKPTSRTQPTRPLTCVYCDKPGHYPDECKRYATVADWKEQLNKKRRCYLCLSRRHTQAECDSARQCAHCQMSRPPPSQPLLNEVWSARYSHYSKAISHTSRRGGSSTVDMYRTANTHRTRYVYPHRWTGSGPYANCHRSGGEPTASRLNGDSTYPVRQRQLPHVHYADLGRQTPASSEQSGHAIPRNVWERCRPAHLCTQC